MFILHFKTVSVQMTLLTQTEQKTLGITLIVAFANFCYLDKQPQVGRW